MPPPSPLHSPLFQRCTSESRGRHLRATAPIDAGRLLWCERPLVCLQSRDNLQYAHVCSHCHAFLGGPDVAMERRFHSDRADRPLPQHQGRMVPCRHACGHWYCSSDCEQGAWRLQHRVFCTGRCDSMDHPLVQFKHWAVQTNEILLLVAEWWVAQHAVAAAQPPDWFGEDSACLWWRKPEDYNDFCMEPWWDVETGPLRSQPGGFVAAASLEATLRDICDTAAERLNEALDAYNQQQPRDDEESQDYVRIPAISAMDIAKRVGACSQNAMGIRQRHPLCRDIFSREFRETWHQDIVQALADAEFIGNGDSACCDDEDKEGEYDKNGNGTGSGETIPRPDAATSESELDEWDYSVDEVADFLSQLFVDEDGSVLDADEEGRENERDATGDDLDYIFPPLDGTAMYSLICKMNHSCDPNVIVLYKRCGYGSEFPLTAFAVALKPIAVDEELTISYIDKGESYEERRKALDSYGFTCTCARCEAESKPHGGALCEQQTNMKDGEDLFGEVDTDDGSNQEDEETLSDATGEEKLQKNLGRLDSRSNHCRLGSIPMKDLACASSYAISTAKALSLALHDPIILGLLEKLMEGLECKDFCLCNIVGNDLEQLLLHKLQSVKSWPSTEYRQAYWCSVLAAAIGLAHECAFIRAQCLLDKGAIFGLPKDDRQLLGLHSYVEFHAAQVTNGPYLLSGFVTLPDFSEPEIQRLLVQKGLSQPIRVPILEMEPELTPELFRSDFVTKGKACVLRGMARHWAATAKWRDLTWLSRTYGHRLVPVEIGSMLANNMTEELQFVRDFVKGLLVDQRALRIWSLADAVDPSSRVSYIAQHPLLNQIRDLQSDLVMSPSLLGPSGPTHVYVWIGSGGTRTPLHFDSYDNLFVQIVGAKYIRLYRGDDSSRLYRSSKSSYGLQGNMSEVDCEREDFSLHPMAREAEFEEALLLPGDAIFIPSGTWHYVRSLSTSFSVNYWF